MVNFDCQLDETLNHHGNKSLVMSWGVYTLGLLMWEDPLLMWVGPSHKLGPGLYIKDNVS